MVFMNGDTYEGEWHRDKMEGRGVFTWPSGARYDGEWKAGKREGRGVYTWPDGKRYDGELKADKREGRGVHTWPDGTRYDGEWKADKTEGRGLHTWPDGKRYDGEYKAGQREGRGLFTLADGRAFEGLFKADMPVSGQMVELDGAVFLASFDGKTAVSDWQPTTKRRVGTLEGGWRDARGARWLGALAWDEGGGRFEGSWRGMCPVAGSVVKADGSVWAVIYDGRTTFAEGAAPVLEVRSPARSLALQRARARRAALRAPPAARECATAGPGRMPRGRGRARGAACG